MWKIILISAMLFFCACNDRSKFGFTSGNCDEVYTNCLNDCTQKNNPRSVCLDNCARSQGMCESIKVKGCMQDCNKYHPKDKQQADICKQRCEENRGVSY